MALDIYQPAVLNRVVSSLENPPSTFLRDAFFRFVQLSQTRRIVFDVENKVRRVAPYVSPLVPGVLMERRGYTTHSFEPPYVKPKSVITPGDAIPRVMGEPLAGTLTPAQRRDMIITQSLTEHEEAIIQLEEVQASEALRLGQVTVTGEGFGTVVIDFGRHADLTVALTGTDQWDDAAATPLADIEAWALLVRQRSGGAIVRDVTMDPDAWTNFIARLTAQQIETLFNTMRASDSRVELGPRTAEKVVRQGTIGQFTFWTYSDTYQDVDGNPQDVMPSGSVILASPQLEGTRCYGVIEDVRALIPATRYSKMWIEEDPSVEVILTQSAPLMVPYRPNASLGATVL